MWPDGRLPAVDETFTTRPQPRSAMAGMAARIRRIGAITFRSHAACQSSSGTSASFLHFAWPALLTTTSSWPKRSVASATIRSAAPASVTSSASVAASPPLAPGFGGGARQLLFAAGDQEDGRALFAEALRDVEPDAAARAGDDAGLAVEAEVHVPDSTDV